MTVHDGRSAALSVYLPSDALELEVMKCTPISLGCFLFEQPGIISMGRKSLKLQKIMWRVLISIVCQAASARKTGRKMLKPLSRFLSLLKQSLMMRFRIATLSEF